MPLPWLTCLPSCRPRRSSEPLPEVQGAEAGAPAPGAAFGGKAPPGLDCSVGVPGHSTFPPASLLKLGRPGHLVLQHHGHPLTAGSVLRGHPARTLGASSWAGPWGCLPRALSWKGSKASSGRGRFMVDGAP